MIYELTMPLPATMNEIINQARSGWQASNQLKKYWTNLTRRTQESGARIQN